ncbi:YqzE family protein [Paenibacillus marinisediminis]
MSKSKRDDLIKYITEQVVTYMETPKEARKEQKVRKKEQWSVRWFGVMPLSMKMTAGRIGQAGKPMKHVIVRITDRMRNRKWTKMT